MTDETPPPGEVWVGKQSSRNCYHNRRCGYVCRIEEGGHLRTMRKEIASAWYDLCSACETGQRRDGTDERYAKQPEDLVDG